MFLIFKDEKEPMAEEVNSRIMFEQINHTELKHTIVVLEALNRDHRIE